MSDLKSLSRSLSRSLSLSGRPAGHDNESWVFVAPVGRSFYDGRRVRDISEDLAKEFLVNFRLANAHFERSAPPGKSVYRFPVNVEHRGGVRLGDLLDAKISGEGDDYGIYVKTRWLDSTWDEIQAGRARHVSIETRSSYTLEDGTVLGPTLTGYAITTEPRIQSIGTIQDTLDLSLSIGAINMDELNQLFDSVIQRIEGLEQRVAAFGENLDTLNKNFAEALTRLEEAWPKPEAEAEEETAEEEEAIEAAEGEEPEEASDTEAEKATEEDATIEASREASRETSREASQSFDLDKDEIRGWITEAVQSVITEKAPSTAHLNLSQKGDATAPPAVVRDATQRAAQLRASGMSPREVARVLYEEGF